MRGLAPESASALVDRHETLRTTFPDGRWAPPSQVIAPSLTLALPDFVDVQEDLREWPDGDREADGAFGWRVEEEASTPLCAG